MSRRKFMFRSLQSALLLSPVFELRKIAAQTGPKKVIPFFFVDGGSPYPHPDDFFPAAGTGGNFKLPTVLRSFNNLKSDMVILDGVKMGILRPNIKGNSHISSVGKVLTSIDVHKIPGTNDGLPGGPSIDQVIARNLKVRSAEVLVNHKPYNSMRARPFAVGNKQFKLPIYNVATVWDQLFKQCQPTFLQTNVAQSERIKRLRADRSIMDSLLEDLSRVRRELSGVEKVKLDSHENAIREAERSVLADLKMEEEIKNGNSKPVVSFDCTRPENMNSSSVPLKSKAHFDVLYAALKTERIGVAGMMHGYSSVQWNFEWLKFDGILKDDVHDAIFHRAETQRNNFNKISHWKWTEIAKFAEKLKNEPGYSLLNKVLIYATSHFGYHHSVYRTPVVLIGNAQGQLKTGRSLKVETYNDRPLTSMAHFCGVKIKGIGQNMNCGPLSELHV